MANRRPVQNRGLGAALVVGGIGKAAPDRVVSNDEIAKRIGVSPEWIEARTGIRERRFAEPGESASSLGAAAARRALSSGGGGGDIDAVIVATSTPDYPFPPTAAIIQHELGIKRAAAFDVGAACAGFIYGLAAGAGMIAGGFARRTLVIGVDLLSRHLDLDDPTTAPLFGDGAAAVILEEAPGGPPLLMAMGSDGSGETDVYIPGGGSRTPPAAESFAEGLHFIRMSGREVYRQAVRIMTRLGVELGAEACDLVVAHQANRRILAEVAGQLGVPPEKFFVNIERYGNTSAASVPLALTEAWEQGRLTPGDRVVLLGLGAGYTWGGAVLTWTLPPRGEEESLPPRGEEETNKSRILTEVKR